MAAFGHRHQQRTEVAARRSSAATQDLAPTARPVGTATPLSVSATAMQACA
jgi:hypothetical protein